MKTITLKKLELTNYRNIEHAVYEFNGNSKIVGDNRIGKTNTLESIYWLLTNKLLNGSSDITQIKPLTNTRLEVEVKATFQVDEKEITIAKKYGEEWVVARATGEETLKGHYTEYYYNGIKQSTVNDYLSLFCEDFGVKIADIELEGLINPFYLGEKCDSENWKEVRQLIIKIVGDATDEDVFLKEPATAILKPELEKCGGRIDQLKKGIADNIKAVKEELLKDTAKIDLLSKIEKPTGDIAEIESKIAKIKDTKEFDALKAKEARLLIDKETFERYLNDKKVDIHGIEIDLFAEKNNKAVLLTDYRTKKTEGVVVESVCPVCKRPLDAKQVEEAKKNAVAKKDTELELIIIEGKKIATKIEKLETQLATMKTDFDNYTKRLDETNKELANVRIELKKYNSVDPAEIETLLKQKAEIELYNKQLKELETLKAEKDNHQSKLVQLEQSRNLVERYILTKLNMLNDNVSKVFGGIKFKLMEETLNGNLVPVCKPYIYDTITKTSSNVLWKSGSKSERVATGIAIVEAIKSKLEISDLPYLFDEGGEISEETMTTRLNTKSQLICVKVEDGVKTPTIRAI